MDYLPEWKIYLWKKLILDKDGEFDGKLTIMSFCFFDPKEQRQLERDKAQKTIDTINLAVASKSLTDIYGRSTSFKDSFFHFSPLDVFGELVDLQNKQGCLEIIDIHIDKNFLKKYHADFKYYGFGEEVYKKIIADQGLTLKDLGFHIYPDMYRDDRLIRELSFKITVSKKKLGAKLVAYLNDFGKNNLIGPRGIRYIDAKKQQSDFLSALHKLSEKYGPNITATANEIAKAGGWYLKDEHHYRFYETLLVLEKEGHITINNLRKEEVLLTLKSIPPDSITPTTSVPNNTQLYLTKEGDDFRYRGKLLQLSRKADHYTVFCALYALLPNGGEIEYSKLGREIQSRVPKSKRYGKEKLQKFILTNLTDRSNGFLHYAEIPQTEDNGKPLISVNRGTGIIFNNTAG